jgi:hypothetical protein
MSFILATIVSTFTPSLVAHPLCGAQSTSFVKPLSTHAWPPMLWRSACRHFAPESPAEWQSAVSIEDGRSLQIHSDAKSISMEHSMSFQHPFCPSGEWWAFWFRFSPWQGISATFLTRGCEWLRWRNDCRVATWKCPLEAMQRQATTEASQLPLETNSSESRSPPKVVGLHAKAIRSDRNEDDHALVGTREADDRSAKIEEHHHVAASGIPQTRTELCKIGLQVSQLKDWTEFSSDLLRESMSDSATLVDNRVVDDPERYRIAHVPKNADTEQVNVAPPSTWSSEFAPRPVERDL